jgi:hypothetical protein
MNTTVPGSTADETNASILDIAQRGVDSAKADPRIRDTAGRAVADIRTTLGKTVVIDAANDAGMGPKAPQDAKTLMAYVQQEIKELIKQGYTPEQAQHIVMTKKMPRIRLIAEIADDKKMQEAIRYVEAVIISNLGKQPDGPDKGTDIGRFTSGVKRGAAFAMRGRGGRT